MLDSLTGVTSNTDLFGPSNDGKEADCIKPDTGDRY